VTVLPQARLCSDRLDPTDVFTSLHLSAEVTEASSTYHKCCFFLQLLSHKQSYSTSQADEESKLNSVEGNILPTLLHFFIFL